MTGTDPRADLIVLGGAPSAIDYLRDVWNRREYAIEVPLSSVRAAHMNTLLGNLWHVINPLLLVGVYYLVFGVIIGTDRGIDNFLAFLAIGVFTFRFTQNAVQNCAGSIVGNDGLIRSIYFPRAILPLSVVVEQLLVLAPAVVVLLIITVLTGQPPMLSWLVIPAVFLLQAAFSLGAGFIAARVTDTFRDFQNLLPFVFRILFYLSGVLYSVDRYVESESLRRLFHANPMFAFITLARWALLGEPLPGSVLLSAVAWTAVLLTGGFLFFKAAEARYGRG